MSLEQTIDNLQIRNANMVTFVGTSNTMVDTTTGRIQTKGIQHNSNVITDVSGPHGRGVATLKKYPDIIFEKEKFEYNNSSNTYSQAGYTVSVSSQDANLTNDERGIVYYMFDGAGAGPYDNQWTSASASNYGAGTFNNTNAHYQIAATDVDGATIPHGEWIKLKMPKKIRLERVFLQPNLSNMNETPEDFKIYGSNDGTTWKLLITQTGMVPRDAGNDIIPATTISGYYDEYAIVITKIYNNAQPDTSIEELEFYGYEEDPPAGDHSVDTTFKSRFNNAQTTGVQVLVDGATGVGTNQISGGPDPSGNQSTYVTDGKYWTLNGTLTSNLSVEANTFLEGDQPHAVSVWFNSSNLEANVSNTCVFSIASEEKLDSVNLDLQSNTWHNLTYAYQGEGGSRVTYLDGRKVAEDQAEDTFGDYPPFAMTGYSQSGYVVSASSEYIPTPQYRAWEAFNDITASDYDNWTSGDFYAANGGDGTRSTVTWSGSTNHNGEFIKLELPHKLIVNYVKFEGRQGSGVERQLPRAFTIIGSNDDVNWETIHQETRTANPSTGETHAMTGVSKHKGFKYIALVPRNSGTTNTNTHISIGNISYYGHRENDLVRFPDPTNVLKYPHIEFTPTTNYATSIDDSASYAERGYIATSSTGDAGRLFNGTKSYFTSFGANSGASTTYTGNSNHTLSGFARTGISNEVTTEVGGTTHTGTWVDLETPRKLKLSQFKVCFGSGSSYAPHSPTNYRLLGRNATSDNWNLLFTIDGAYPNGTTAPSTGGTDKALHAIATSDQAFYKYHRWVCTRLHSTNSAGTGYVGGANISRPMLLYGVEYYGTEEGLVPIQIGGGNIDKVANFRVYDKFIEEDQVNEIWNAQKEEFGRAKPQMVLQQGKLGIGTDAPQGSLSVADEPHNVEEFPPRAMTDYKTYIEGHGEFCTSESNVYTSGYESYKAFNKNSTGTSGNWWTQSDAGIVPSYSTSSGDFSYFSYDSQYSTNVEGATKMGHWLQIEFPYKINYRYSDIQAPHHSIGRQPRAGYILGSNDLTGVWTSLHNFTNVTRTHAYESVRYTPPTVSTQTFKYFRLVIEELNGDQYAGIARWDIFGTREQGQSVLHDGQLTLTKNLDVPRIGPPLDADDTPRRDRLVMEYNTSSNPTFEGVVRDTSGRGNDGKMHGNVIYDPSDKAFTFDGADDMIDIPIPRFMLGDPEVTVSIWVKPLSIPSGSWDMYAHVGRNTNNQQVQLTYYDGSGGLHIGGYGQNIQVTGNYILNAGTWYHLCMTIKPGAWSTSLKKLYVNGYLVSGQYLVGSGTTNISDDDRSRISFGGLVGEGRTIDHEAHCFMSNMKVYDVALTSEEVKTLYDMGRNGKIIPRTLQIDTPVQINAPLYAPKNVINITQSFYDGAFATTSSTLQDVYTTEWIQMRKNSEVEVDLSVVYRNDGTAWGGMYLLAFFMVDVPVGSVAANTWVAYLTPGYYMSYYQEIYEYGNTSYLPFKIPTDYKIRFKFQVRVYNNGTLYINRAHHLHFENGQFANLRQFIPMSTKRYEQGSSGNNNTYFNGHTGGTKFIIKEIAG